MGHIISKIKKYIYSSQVHGERGVRMLIHDLVIREGDGDERCD